MHVNNYYIGDIIWNLFLLIIPFFITIFLNKFYQKNKTFTKKNKIILYFSFFIWLIFIPNTAYVIVDVRHIVDYCPYTRYRVCTQNAWMIMFFFLYSIIGWPTMVFLINQMKELIIKIYNKKIADTLILILIPLIFLGVLLGLLQRWNSWNILSHPWFIFKDIFVYLSNYFYFRNYLFFTFSFFCLYFIGNYLFNFTKLEKLINKYFSLLFKNKKITIFSKIKTLLKLLSNKFNKVFINFYKFFKKLPKSIVLLVKKVFQKK